MHFDIHEERAKSSRDRTLVNNYYKKSILAFGLKTNFLSENPDELCDKLKLLLQEKQTRINSNIIIQEMVAINVEILAYKCITSTQHKTIFKKKLLHKIISVFMYKFTNSNMKNNIIITILVRIKLLICSCNCNWTNTILYERFQIIMCIHKNNFFHMIFNLMNT